jgi:serine/threonine-protein kinase RsbW
MTGHEVEECALRPSELLLRERFEVPGAVAAITDVVERIMLIVNEMECAVGHEFEIELAITEALANAVVHGCRKDPDKRVELCIACDAARGMLIVVRDPGEGFDPSRLPSPIQGENLYASHGRGVFLINQLMDEVRYERGGTELWMRKGGR